MTRPKPVNNDFDYDEIVKATSDHQKTLDEVQSQIQQIAGIVQPIIDKENFSEYFSRTIKSHTALSEAISDTLKKLILESPDIKEAIKAEVKNSDRIWIYQFMRRVGWAIGAVILALISGLAGYWFNS